MNLKLPTVIRPEAALERFADLLLHLAESPLFFQIDLIAAIAKQTKKAPLSVAAREGLPEPGLETGETVTPGRRRKGKRTHNRPATSAQPISRKPQPKNRRNQK
jgi:hypothetical protein